MKRILPLFIPQCFAALACAIAFATPSLADIYGYWPLDAAPGGVAPNAVGGGTDATLNGAAVILVDPTRGSVLNVDGSPGTYAAAGTLPTIAPTTDFTWSFWARQTQADPPAEPNDVILGNRQPDAGWIKFTPTNFEYRDITPTFNNGVDIPDFTQGLGWTHNAVVKTGDQMIFYRNGIATGFSVATGTVNAAPFYMGGDALAGENWGGMLDDVAVWTDALPRSSIAGIARGIYTPATAPTSGSGGGTPTLQTVFSDNFDGGVLSGAWNAIDRGLESTGPAGYNAPDLTTNPGRLTLGGTTSNQYWYGSSVITDADFSSAIESEIAVDRVSLSGAGTAFRSSLWIYGDDGHYLHFSQNMGEGGWSFNANDVGGIGTNQPTGGGVNIALLDVLDGNGGNHEMKIVLSPTGEPGDVSMFMYLDSNLVAIQGFSNFPDTYKVMLTGQGRAIGDTVSAVFDNVRVSQVPEPSTCVLLACAMPLLARRWMRRNRARV
ncbi:MAG: LamG-like jellyroll fold domain-containing protein [Pirellulales bacterium]